MRNLEKKLKMKGYSPLEDQDTHMLIAMNGVFGEPNYGYPAKFGDIWNDYLNAGVFFIKNTPESKDLLNSWYYGPKNMTDTENAEFKKYGKLFSREQRILNLLIYPLYKNLIEVYNCRDFHSPIGSIIRHVWSPIRNEEQWKMKMSEDLQEIMEIQQISR